MIATANRVSCILAILVLVQAKLPDYIKACSRSDPHINACINSSVYAILPYLKNGIPELDVPPLEPLTLDAVVPIPLGGPGSQPTNVSEISISGASDFEILELTTKISRNYFKFKVNCPKLKLRAKYSINTKLLFLELKGDGPIKIDVTNYLFECVLQGHKARRGDKNYMEFEKMICNANITKADVRLENLFENNAQLAQATNDVINDNYQLFFEEIRPALLDAITGIFTNISNQICSQTTYEELFLP